MKGIPPTGGALDRAKGDGKRGRRELSSIRLAVPASRSAAISQMNRAAERLFHHGLELDVSERTFLLQMCTNAFEFVVADAFAQPDAIGVRTYFWIRNRCQSALLESRL
jgi:hypothetical protein